MHFPQTLAVESWTLYALGVLIVAARIVSQWIRSSSGKRLHVEDYMMLFVLATYTADMWAINQVAVNGSNYMSPETAAALTPEGVQQAIWGSKMTLALEMFTLATEWIAKWCLVILYYRLTSSMNRQRLAVKLIGVYCVVSYILVAVLCLTVWCHPIYEYWRVPVRYSQCATYYHHMIFATTMNITSDLLLISIPIHLVIRVNLPLKRKVILVCILCLGIFNILTTVLNRYYNFTNPNDIEYINWYVGEVSTAVYVANIPLTWPIVRKIFGFRPWWDESGGLGGNADNQSPTDSTKWQPARRRRSPDESLLAFSSTVSNTVSEPLSSQRASTPPLRLDPTYHPNNYKITVQSPSDAKGRPSAEMTERGILSTIDVRQSIV